VRTVAALFRGAVCAVGSPDDLAQFITEKAGVRAYAYAVVWKFRVARGVKISRVLLLHCLTNQIGFYYF
jgi:hypothetical protein